MSKMVSGFAARARALLQQLQYERKEHATLLARARKAEADAESLRIAAVNARETFKQERDSAINSLSRIFNLVYPITNDPSHLKTTVANVELLIELLKQEKKIRTEHERALGAQKTLYESREIGLVTALGGEFFDGIESGDYTYVGAVLTLKAQRDQIREAHKLEADARVKAQAEVERLRDVLHHTHQQMLLMETQRDEARTARDRSIEQSNRDVEKRREMEKERDQAAQAAALTGLDLEVFQRDLFEAKQRIRGLLEGLAQSRREMAAIQLQPYITLGKAQQWERELKRYEAWFKFLGSWTTGRWPWWKVDTEARNGSRVRCRDRSAGRLP